MCATKRRLLEAILSQTRGNTQPIPNQPIKNKQILELKVWIQPRSIGRSWTRRYRWWRKGNCCWAGYYDWNFQRQQGPIDGNWRIVYCDRSFIVWTIQLSSQALIIFNWFNLTSIPHLIILVHVLYDFHYLCRFLTRPGFYRRQRRATSLTSRSMATHLNCRDILKYTNEPFDFPLWTLGRISAKSFLPPHIDLPLANTLYATHSYKKTPANFVRNPS